MHNLYKLAWTMRALVYRVLFGRFDMPSYLGRPIFLVGTRRIFIMKRVRILPHLRAEVHGSGRLVINENVRIGQNFHVTCMSELVIDSGTIITGNVVVTDIDHEYGAADLSVIDQPLVHSKTRIGKNCFIGAGACIQAGTILGDGCIVGANAVVRGVFENHSVIVGAPGRVVKRFNRETAAWERP